MEKDTENQIPQYVHQGANVQRIRQTLGIKQETLAEMMGTTQQFLSRVEKRQLIGKNMLARVSKALQVPAEIIEKLEENPMSIVVENNTFEGGSYNQTGVNPKDTKTINNQQIHPLDKFIELTKETSTLYERMIAAEKEKIALLEKLLEERDKK